MLSRQRAFAGPAAAGEGSGQVGDAEASLYLAKTGLAEPRPFADKIGGPAGRREEWFYFTENKLSPGAARVGNYKALFNQCGDNGQPTGGLAIDSDLGWKGPEKYAFPCMWTDAMMKTFATCRAIVVTSLVLLATMSLAHAADPLPSWNDGAAKRAIVEFVGKVTKAGSPDFVPDPERIATFDNDGTLWAEQPMYFQLLFALDRVKALAPTHPEWKTTEPFASLLGGDVSKALAGGEKAIAEIVMATHAGMTTTEFEQIVRDWIATATHPRTGRLYSEMVYQPMLELLAYLRANGFKTFIVSGGGIEFMRPWTEKVYGIPPEQVVGSSIKTHFEVRDGKPVLVRLPAIDFVDDKAGKPEGINSHIGRRPIAAFGNSDGDREMLEWTQGGGGNRLMMLVHHDDAAREWAYGPNSKIGTFSDALMAEAKKQGWIAISMKNDWNAIFPLPGK